MQIHSRPTLGYSSQPDFWAQRMDPLTPVQGDIPSSTCRPYGSLHIGVECCGFLISEEFGEVETTFGDCSQWADFNRTCVTLPSAASDRPHSLHNSLTITDWFGVVLFSGYILYDFNRAQFVTKTFSNGAQVGVAIFLDVINLFIRS